MKLKKMLNKLNELTNADLRRQLKHYDDIKHILKKLRTKRDLLIEELKDASPDKKIQIKQQLKIVEAQRGKGIATLKALKDARKAKKDHKS